MIKTELINKSGPAFEFQWDIPVIPLSIALEAIEKIRSEQVNYMDRAMDIEKIMAAAHHAADAQEGFNNDSHAWESLERTIIEIIGRN